MKLLNTLSDKVAENSLLELLLKVIQNALSKLILLDSRVIKTRWSVSFVCTPNFSNAFK